MSGNDPLKPCPNCGRLHPYGPATVQQRERAIRGGLCSRCALALGWWKDDPDPRERSAHDAAQRLEERRSASIFAYGLARALGRRTYVIYHPEADRDADFAIEWPDEDGSEYYWPVQLKDLTPARGQDPGGALATLLADAAITYPTSPDLILAIEIKCGWSSPEISPVPQMNVLEVWLFGPLGGGVWNIVGDLRRTEWIEQRFTLPEQACEDAGLPMPPGPSGRGGDV